MHITSLKIESLFGRFNYEFRFYDEGEKINLIHGLNGSGKTKILDLLRLIASRDLISLEKQPFKRISVAFSNNTTFCMDKQNAENVQAYILASDGSVLNTLRLKRNNSSVKSGSPRHPARMEFISYLNHAFDNFTRIGGDKWKEIDSGKIFNLEELFFELENFLPTRLRERYRSGLYFYDVKELPEIKLRYIDTKRLIEKEHLEDFEIDFDEGPQEVSALEKLSGQIGEKIREATALYASVTQILDSNYVSKITDKLTLGAEISTQKVKQKLQSLREKEKMLNEVGLLEGVTTQLALFGENLTDENKPLLHVIDLHCDNTEEKLAKFDVLLQQINLLTKVIGKRFSYKNIKVGSKGITAVDKETKDKILLDDLSSGEQHELYLFATLIFNSGNPDILFIDEPEISLHIAWQEEFIEDLLQIKDLKNTQIFIATHSPSIIGRRYSSSFDLQRMGE